MPYSCTFSARWRNSAQGSPSAWSKHLTFSIFTRPHCYPPLPRTPHYRCPGQQLFRAWLKGWWPLGPDPDQTASIRIELLATLPQFGVRFEPTDLNRDHDPTGSRSDLSQEGNRSHCLFSRILATYQLAFLSKTTESELGRGCFRSPFVDIC